MAGPDYGSLFEPSAQGKAHQALPPLPHPRPPAEAPEGRPHSILRSGSDAGGGGGGGPRKARRHVSLWELVLLPWALLVAVLACYYVGGASGDLAALALAPLALAGLSVAFVWHHYRSGNNAEIVLGLLCVTAVLIGLVVGAYSELRCLSEYRRLARGASYFNVLPSEPALGKRDATTLDFAEGARVDVHRTFGFLDASPAKATAYCVAPVSGGEGRGHGAARVQFWAAGVDCCEARGNFQCGAAGNSAAHGAVVLPEAAQQSRGFTMAVRGAEHAYGITASEDFLLVSWAKDPVAHAQGLRSGALMLALVFGGVYLIISSMVGCALAPVIVPK